MNKTGSWFVNSPAVVDIEVGCHDYSREVSSKGTQRSIDDGGYSTAVDIPVSASSC